ncbi:MAG TPA: glycosyltransferase family 39 protein [Burkholderiales bacterium]|nr:glycosyltransferase family 39 protein [Burkholderiales bacterium]
MTRSRVVVFLVLLALAWFGTLGIRPLYKADESRYGEISREMLASGDWVTPRLNGFRYLEKPPLQYWATAALFSFLGEKDYVARLWTALIGFAGILLVLYAGNRLWGAPAGAYAAAALAGSPLYVLLGQVNTLDMTVSVFLAAALVAFLLGRMLWFWAACAAAVLSKGLIGIVLPGGAIFFFLLIKRDWRLIARMRPVAGPALFLAIAAPWFVAVSAANPEFLRFFFIQEHFQRFTTEMHQRVEPAWFFVPILLAGLGPWLLPFLRSLKPRDDATLLLVVWTLLVLAFFSASGSKLPPYILPVFPAAALLIGRSLAREWPQRLFLMQVAALVIVGASAAFALPLLAGSYADYARWLSLAFAVVAVAAGVAGALALRGARTAAVIALAAGGLAATQIGLAGHLTIAERFSVAATVARLPGLPPRDAPVYAVGVYDHTLPWTLKRTVTMVVHRDELEKEIDWDPAKFIPDLASFARAWQAAPQAWAFVRPGMLAELRSRFGLPMQELARGPTYVIVKKP